MNRNGIFISGYLLDAWNTHHIDISNTVNGKPAHYWKDQNGGTIPPGAGEVILANCTNVMIENQNVSHGSVGILLGFSYNNYIANNTAFSNNMYGVDLCFSEFNNLTDNSAIWNGASGFYFYSSSNNTLESNKILYNSNGIAFAMSCDYNNITDNYIFSNTNGIQISDSIGDTIQNNILLNNTSRGIRLSQSTSHNITTNIVSDHSQGISLSSADRNDIINNHVSDNNYGFYLTDSSNNSIFSNNIIENTIQAKDDSNDNFWNSSYPVSGNHWSDFDEPVELAFDDYQGEDQKTPGNDGIVDLGPPAGGKNPYVIDLDSMDHYPLLGNYIVLYEGWNLISIPLIQPDTDLDTVLSSISGSYDAVQVYDITESSDPWKHYHISKPPLWNDLIQIDHKIGFWIHITKPGGVIFECPGARPIVNQTITLFTGWNLVGYPSLIRYNRTAGLNNIKFGSDVDCIQWYDASAKAWHFMGTNDSFVRGRGYWVHSKVDKTWDVPL